MRHTASKGVILRRPSSAEIDYAIEHWDDYAALAKTQVPTDSRGEWNRDHTAYYIACVFPALRLPLWYRRIAIEAFLAGMEPASDGSSVVPESCKYGKHVKDWQGVVHDYLFELHRLGLADAYGHEWGYHESNWCYAQLWYEDGRVTRGTLWLIGLEVGAWVAWNGKPVTQTASQP